MGIIKLSHNRKCENTETKFLNIHRDKDRHRSSKKTSKPVARRNICSLNIV